MMKSFFPQKYSAQFFFEIFEQAKGLDDGLSSFKFNSLLETHRKVVKLRFLDSFVFQVSPEVCFWRTLNNYALPTLYWKMYWNLL